MRRQVLYHFISERHFKFILGNNFNLKFGEPDGDHLLLKDRYISTTRLYNLNWTGSIRLSLDSDKLKRDYKIVPIHYFNIMNKVLIPKKYKKSYDLRDVSNIEVKNKKHDQYCKNELNIVLNQFEERIMYRGKGNDNIDLRKYLLCLDTNDGNVYRRFKDVFKSNIPNVSFNYVKEFKNDELH